VRNPFRRRPSEVRSIDSVPWTWGAESRSVVDQAKALSLTPVYAAVRIIAQDLSTLPLKSYRKVDGERVPMSGMPALFSTLLDDGRLQPWLFRAVSSLALRGNAYGLVTQRDGFGFPTVIEWFNPAEVSCNDDMGAAPDWRWRGRPVPDADMVHIPWFVLPGKRQGLSPIGAFGTTIGIGLHAQNYSSNWFETGVPPGTFQNTSQMVSQEDAQTAKARLVSAIRSRQPIVYGKDWTYTPISVSPKDAQMVEVTKMTANQIAGVYGVRPEKIGGDAGSSLTYATVEQNQLEYVTETLRFWAELLEGHFFGLLPQRQYVKFNLDALVRSDLKTRFEVYEIGRPIGVLNVDEIRKLEDRPALPDGQGQDYTPIMPGAAVPALEPATEDDDTTDADNVTALKRWVTPT
jgi:HK97 family phage portal protein